MFGIFERMVAMRYLRSRRQEGFISVIAGFSLLGIGLGVATLIIVMSVMNGFRAELIGRILGLNGHMSVYSKAAPMEGFDELAVRIGEIPGVLTVTPQLEGQVMAMANGIASGALVRGLRASALLSRQIVPDNIIAGSLEEFSGKSGVIMGARLARRLRVGVGDKITLISPSTTTTVIGSVPRMRAFTVAALFNVGMYEYDNTFIYMPLKAAQTFFKSGDAVNAVEVMVNDPQQVDEIRLPLRKVIGTDKYSLDWKQQNSSFFNALEVERNVMFLILTLIILVAAFNIISSMIMLVKDKGRDIAILRTMGASKGMVMRIFFMSGASIGVIGTIGGTILGLVFCDNIETIRQGLQSLTGTELFSAEIYFLSKLPAEVDALEVITVVSMALFLSFAATIYPAWRASRLDPVEALRYE
ncbi:lipoprotein-releasing ABC transporter permease subunit [Nisaea sp.]|uniref:lipoprotein-releasing ABC transporter permease subunit n=1 Tax=Nisaea sp. TaxID=2024842 RepID=UPI0032ECB347